MNRKSFLKSLGILVTLPFVSKGESTLSSIPKPVQKQTKIEQNTLKKFYSPSKMDVSGSYICFSGVMPEYYGEVSGKVPPKIAAKFREEGIW